MKIYSIKDLPIRNSFHKQTQPYSEKELQAILSQNPGGTGQASRGANRQQPAEVRDYALNRDELIVYKFDKKKLKTGRQTIAAEVMKNLTSVALFSGCFKLLLS